MNRSGLIKQRILLTLVYLIILFAVYLLMVAMVRSLSVMDRAIGHLPEIFPQPQSFGEFATITKILAIVLVLILANLVRVWIQSPNFQIEFYFIVIVLAVVLFLTIQFFVRVNLLEIIDLIEVE